MEFNCIFRTKRKISFTIISKFSEYRNAVCYGFTDTQITKAPIFMR